MLLTNARPLYKIRAQGVGMCACHIWRPIISIISADIQFTVIVTGEALAPKNHNHDV